MPVSNISNYYFVEQARSDINRVQRELLNTQRMTATGRRVEDVKDAAVLAAPVVTTRQMMARAEARGEALNEVKPRLQLQDLSLGRGVEVARELRLDIISMISLNNAERLTERLQEAFAVAATEINATWNGGYMFGGDRTDAPPLAVTSLGALAALPSGTAAFNTVQRAQTLDLGDGFNVQIADRGVDVASDLFEAFRQIQLVLDANGGTLTAPLTPAQKAALEAALPALDQAATTMSQAQARNGELAKRVDRESVAMSQRVSTLEKALGDQVDADLAEVALRLSQLQVQYQATATTFSQLKDLSLLNYLRT